MILYLVKSTLLLALLLGLYKLLLENEKMHRFNRFYLMFALVIGLTAPLIQFEIAPNTTVAGIELDKVDQIVEAPSEYVARNIEPIIAPAPSPAETIDDQAASVPETSFPTGIVLLTIYLSVTTLLIIRFGHGLFQIFSSVRKGISQPTTGATLVLLEEPITPQSFMKWIFLNREEYESGKIGEEILEHERAHIRQLHSLDVVFTEVLKAIFWFNPFMYWYKQAVLLNHEFLADEHVVTKVSPREQYQEKLLEFASSDTKTSITNKFSHPNSKRRVVMLFKNYRRRTASAKKLLVFSISISVAVVTTIQVKAQTVPESSLEELASALLDKIKSQDELSSDEKLALTKLFMHLPEKGLSSASFGDMQRDTKYLEYLYTEFEKYSSEHLKLTEKYLEAAKPENTPTLEGLRYWHRSILVNYELFKLVSDQIGSLHKEKEMAPPRPFPPMPPTPEQIMDGRSQ